MLFIIIIIIIFNNSISSSICKLPISSEIYNCTFKNTNKVSIITRCPFNTGFTAFRIYGSYETVFSALSCFLGYVKWHFTAYHEEPPWILLLSHLYLGLCSARYWCEVVVCFKGVLKNKQTKTKITTTTQPWKALFCRLKCHPSLCLTPRTGGKLFPATHPTHNPTHEKSPTMHTSSPQFLSVVAGSDVLFPVSRNGARRVHCLVRFFLNGSVFS